jgi:ribonuclease E
MHAIHKQAGINELFEAQFQFLRHKTQQRDEVDALYYELVHNLVLELTRVGIENRNLKMRLESLSSRMDFDERRARALEGVVQYRPGTGPSREPQPSRPRQDDRPTPQIDIATTVPTATAQGQPLQPGAGPDEQSGESNTARRRRRRRRGRRGGRGRTGEPIVAAGTPGEIASPADSATPPHGDPTADSALEEEPGGDFDEGPAEEPDPSAQ